MLHTQITNLYKHLVFNLCFFSDWSQDSGHFLYSMEGWSWWVYTHWKDCTWPCCTCWNDVSSQPLSRKGVLASPEWLEGLLSGELQYCWDTSGASVTTTVPALYTQQPPNSRDSDLVNSCCLLSRKARRSYELSATSDGSITNPVYTASIGWKDILCCRFSL